MSFEISEEKSHHSQFQGNKIPSDWNCARIKELAKINTETIKKSDKLGVIRYVDIASVNNRQIEQVQILDFEKAPSRARRKVRNGDILISTVRPNLKHFTILKDPPNNMLVSTGFAVISAEKIDPYFLYYFLTSDRYTEFLSNIAENQTSAYPAFNPSVIEETEIYFPERNEQEKISRILSVLDEKIELNNRINKNLEEMAQAIFKSWFVDFEPFRDGEFVESELGMIPKGWEVKELGELAEVMIGGDWGEEKPFAGSQPVVCLRGADLQSLKERGYSKEAPVRYVKISSLKKRQIQEGDILLGGSGAGPVGRSLPVIDELKDIYNHPIIYSNFCKRIRARNVFYALYLEHILQLMHETKEIHHYINGTSVPNLDLQGLMKHKIVVPEESAIKEFGCFKRMCYVNKFKKENIILSTLRDTLLPKLMSGEIRVPLD